MSSRRGRSVSQTCGANTCESPTVASVAKCSSSAILPCMPSSDLGGIMQWARAACQHGGQQKSRPGGRLFSERLSASLLRSCGATPFAHWAKAGGARRDRTADLVNAIHALSHLSYGPAGKQGSTIGNRKTQSETVLIADYGC